MFILKKGHQPGVYVPLRALFLVFFFFLSFSRSGDGFGSNLTPCTYTPPFFMILIIPNIVQNLYLH